MIFGQAFFPLAKPVRLAVGDIVSVSLEANFVNGDYVWRWNTRVCERASSTHVIADFKQSTFSGVLLSLDQLKKWQASR